MSGPYTPAEVRQRKDETAKYIQETVNFINMILIRDTSVTLLLNGQPVEIYDSSNFDAWYIGREAAVQQFVDAGWNVTTRELPPRISGSERREYIYYFRLPAETPPDAD